MSIQYRSGKWCVHKGQYGALQLSVIPATWEKPDSNGISYPDKDGAVLIEMAGKDKEVNGVWTYKWGEKISFAIGMNDIHQILDKYYIGGPIKCFHQSSDTLSKTFSLQPGEGKYEGTWRVSLTSVDKKPDGKTFSIFTSFTAGEAVVFIELLKRSVPVILGLQL